MRVCLLLLGMCLLLAGCEQTAASKEDFASGPVDVVRTGEVVAESIRTQRIVLVDKNNVGEWVIVVQDGKPLIFPLINNRKSRWLAD